MIYTNDPQAVRDAKKDVDDAKLEIQKQSIQDQIDALDEEIDRYNDLIDQINNAADAQIDALEKIKNKWQEVIDQQEYAKDVSLLTGEFGTSAITKILTGNDDDLLAQWKNNYINTLAGIDMESQGYIGNMTQQIASLYGVDLSPLQSQFQGVHDSVSGMTDALAKAANAIGISNISGGAVTSLNTPEGDNTPSTDTGSSLEGAIKGETDTAMASFDQHTDKLTNEVIPAIQSATAEMNAFNESADRDIEKTVTIHYETTGGQISDGNGDVGRAFAEGTTGNAFAKGTGRYKGLPNDEKNALVSEYGQTEMTVFPDGRTIITDTPTLMDLPKDTVIYNEEQTKKILDDKVNVSGNTHADGTDDSIWTTLADGTKIRPLQPGDKMYDLVQKFDTYFKSIDGNLEKLTPNSFYDHQKQMEQVANQITTSNVVTNNNKPNVTIGDIHVTCPGVTEQQVAARLGGVIGKELNRQFSGLHNYVDQVSRIR